MFRFLVSLSLLNCLVIVLPIVVTGQMTGVTDRVDGREFKRLTKVYVEGTPIPVSENQTLFTGSLVFDFRFSGESSSEPTEITIFDFRNRNFVVLDLQRKIKLKLDNLQLVRLLDGMKSELKKSEKTQHLVSEDYREGFQIDENKITIENDFVRYVVRGSRPDDDSILPRYYKFLEHYTLLSVSDPKCRPPFARIRLNQSIKKYGLIPTNVSLNVKANNFLEHAFSVSSKHEIHMTLDKKDRERIESAKQDWVRFQQVELAKYRRIAVADSDQTGLKR